MSAQHTSPPHTIATKQTGALTHALPKRWLYALSAKYTQILHRFQHLHRLLVHAKAFVSTRRAQLLRIHARARVVIALLRYQCDRCESYARDVIAASQWAKFSVEEVVLKAQALCEQHELSQVFGNLQVVCECVCAVLLCAYLFVVLLCVCVYVCSSVSPLS